MADPFSILGPPGSGPRRADLYAPGVQAGVFADELAGECGQGRYGRALEALAVRPALMADGTPAARVFAAVVHTKARQLMSADPVTQDVFWPLLELLGVIDLDLDQSQVRFRDGHAQGLYDKVGRALHEQLWARIETGAAVGDLDALGRDAYRGALAAFLADTGAREGADALLGQDDTAELCDALRVDEREAGRLMDQAMWQEFFGVWEQNLAAGEPAWDKGQVLSVLVDFLEGDDPDFLDAAGG